MSEQDRTGKIIPKWGFGMAPFKPATEVRYCNAIRSMKEFLSSAYDIEHLTPDAISEVKGLVNRCIRQDQWDWFTVYTRFGEPPPFELHPIPQLLTDLRTHLKNEEVDLVSHVRRKLLHANLLTYCLCFLGELSPLRKEDGGGYIYILSIREQPDVLKIGMTTRTVVERVKEINSATGLLIPFSVRRIFKVRDARRAESELFQVLAPHRIRADREFFKISFGDAVRAIEKYLDSENLLVRSKGTIKWFSLDKGYGFVTIDQDEDIFFHISEIPSMALNMLKVNALIEFNIGYTPQGKCGRTIKFL